MTGLWFPVGVLPVPTDHTFARIEQAFDVKDQSHGPYQCERAYIRFREGFVDPQCCSDECTTLGDDIVDEYDLSGRLRRRDDGEGLVVLLHGRPFPHPG